MASLHYKFAAMNSGKSTQLIQAHFNYCERGMTPYAMTPAIDDRFGVGVITARVGLELQADVFTAASDLFLDNPFVGSDLQLKKAMEVVMLGQAAQEAAESAQARESKEQLARQTAIEHERRDLARWAILKEQGVSGSGQAPASP